MIVADDPPHVGRQLLQEGPEGRLKVKTHGVSSDSPIRNPLNSWLVVTGTMEFYDFPYLGNNNPRIKVVPIIGIFILLFDYYLVSIYFPFSWEWKIIPTDELHHFSEG